MPLDQENRKSMSHRQVPRALLRRTPAGRSFTTRSPLLSNPVVRLYGGAELARKTVPNCRPLGKLHMGTAYVVSRGMNNWAEGLREKPDKYGNQTIAGYLKSRIFVDESK